MAAAAVKYIGLAENCLKMFGVIPSDKSSALDVFLDTLTRRFQSTVAADLRAAITDRKIADINAEIIKASTNYNRYLASAGADESFLSTACDAASSASAGLTVEIQRIISDTSCTQIESPAERGAAVVVHLQAMKACAVALQAIAALDIMALEAKAERYPRLNRAIRDQVDDYVKLATTLQETYLDHQKHRGWFKTDLETIMIGGHASVYTYAPPRHHVRITVKSYIDGAQFGDDRCKGTAIGSKEELKTEMEGEASRAIEAKIKTFQQEAKNWLENSEGNLANATKIWENVKKAYAD